jgi:hypothetical protein
MPRGWSAKDERKYERIKESSEQRGAGEDRAQEVAARTVNKGRRQEGRTPNTRTQGTGNPRTALQNRSRDELYNIARDMKIPGRSNMSKQQLESAVRRRG